MDTEIWSSILLTVLKHSFGVHLVAFNDMANGAIGGKDSRLNPAEFYSKGQ